MSEYAPTPDAGKALEARIAAHFPDPDASAAPAAAPPAETRRADGTPRPTEKDIEANLAKQFASPAEKAEQSAEQASAAPQASSPLATDSPFDEGVLSYGEFQATQRYEAERNQLGADIAHFQARANQIEQIQDPEQRSRQRFLAAEELRQLKARGATLNRFGEEIAHSVKGRVESRLKRHVEAEHQKLKAAFEGNFDPAALKEHLLGQGYTERDIASAYDARNLIAHEKARRWDAMQRGPGRSQPIVVRESTRAERRQSRGTQQKPGSMAAMEERIERQFRNMGQKRGK